jgi:hypothetical protein
MKLLVSAIDPNRLCRIRTAGCDEAGNPLVAFSASGWEPLRCCLRRPDAGELIALISYSPFVVPSAWAETGPVFVHAEQCSGYGATESLPDELRTGPRILPMPSRDSSGSDTSRTTGSSSARRCAVPDRQQPQIWILKIGSIYM